MWPSSIKELQKGGFSPSEAGFITIACFVAGFIGIQGFSRWLHSYMPSHVVDCDHSHDDLLAEHDELHAHSHSHGARRASKGGLNGHTHADEESPLLDGKLNRHRSTFARSIGENEHEERTHLQIHSNLQRTASSKTRRPSMMQLPGRVMSFVLDNPTKCDEYGPCKGYTDPCGQECFRTLEARTPTQNRAPTFLRRSTSRNILPPPSVPEHVSEESSRADDSSSHAGHERSNGRQREHASSEDLAHDNESGMEAEGQHHHHVPQNAYMSIGLQTSIAIGLHKLPEGFIMFATNHANPSLGFNVFFALFIHNITEGFAMALPLYLAFGSRLKAMFYAVFLGGLSQPLGAGIAAFWFWAQGTMEGRTEHRVYGCLFGAVSGLMAAVAILLLLEGIAINHNNAWCSAFVLLGFVIFGISTALRA